MPSVSNKQIPQCFRAYRPKWLQWLGRAVLSILGWKVSRKISEEFRKSKLVVIVAPHTSNWDGIVGVGTLAGLDAKIFFYGKHTVFKYFGSGSLLRYMGRIPVDRSKPGGIIKMPWIK
jgi:1-acyl-sn-glycerol-3-phosphate acyltransferase